MNLKNQPRRSFLTLMQPMAAALLAGLALPGASHGQAMFSFEDGVDGWLSSQTPNPAVSTSAFGATDGSSALYISGIPGNYQNDIGRSGLINAESRPEAFRQFELAAAEVAAGRRPKLEFDLTIDPGTAAPLPTWLQLGMFLNSRGGYKDYGTGQLLGGNLGADYPTVATLAAGHGVTLTNLGPNQYRVAVPMRLPSEATAINQGLTLASGEFPYYEIGFKSNGGVTTGSFNYGIDNIRFTGIPTFTTHTLFSWETPDNAGTSGVNEAFEGWVTTNELPAPPTGVTLDPGHAQSITAVGATEGTHAYQIDRRSLQDGFTWGSVFALSGTGSPANQARIGELVSLVNGADRIAFDVTYKDMFVEPDFISPSFTNFMVHFADGSGAFYQASTANIDLNSAGEGKTATLEIPIANFVDAAEGSTKTLEADGLLPTATFFEIGIATSTDDGGVYQIDNFRVLTKDSGQSADFNGDGAVDGEDLTTWDGAFGSTDAGDVDADGDTDGADFLAWQQQATSSGAIAAAAAVPEPSTALLLIGAACMGLRRRRA